MSRSYFDEDAMRSLIEQLKNDGRSPEWLAKALAMASENHALFPSEEDNERFVVEFIYPH